jgi:hypothetical protein
VGVAEVVDFVLRQGLLDVSGVTYIAASPSEA